MDRRGRSGLVHVDVRGRLLQFDWELGGGDCIAFVAAPDPDAWRTLEPHRHLVREAFLAWLAAELAARECPAAAIEVGPAGIHFLERRRSLPDERTHP